MKRSYDDYDILFGGNNKSFLIMVLEGRCVGVNNTWTIANNTWTGMNSHIRIARNDCMETAQPQPFKSFRFIVSSLIK